MLTASNPRHLAVLYADRTYWGAALMLKKAVEATTRAFGDAWAKQQARHVTKSFSCALDFIRGLLRSTSSQPFQRCEAYRLDTQRRPTPVPPVETSASRFRRRPEQRFLLLASDGVFGFMSLGEIRERLERPFSRPPKALKDPAGILFSAFSASLGFDP